MNTTTVTLTGTGVPHPSPGRAGPGALVRHGATAIQFDVGRATVLRLAEAGCGVHELDAVFLTHVHSDHVVDLADLVMTRWLQGTLHRAGALPIVAVDGLAISFAETMLDAYAGVGHLVLTHLIPPPTAPEEEEAFAADVRRGGYEGPLTVGRDLTTIELATGGAT